MAAGVGRNGATMPLSNRETARVEELQRMLAERTGKPGYKANCAALKAEIAKLQGNAGASPDSQESGASAP